MNGTEQDKKSLILDAARRIFLRYGYEKTSMNDIAGDAGMGKGSLYYYFKSKEDIYLELIRKETELVVSSVNQLIESTDNPDEKLRLFFTTTFERLIEFGPLLKSILHQSPNNFMCKLESFRKEIDDRFSSMFISTLRYAQSKGRLSDDVNIDFMARKFLEKGGMLSEQTLHHVSQECSNIAIEEYRTFVNLILYGMLKGKPNA